MRCVFAQTHMSERDSNISASVYSHGFAQKRNPFRIHGTAPLRFQDGDCAY